MPQRWLRLMLRIRQRLRGAAETAGGWGGGGCLGLGIREKLRQMTQPHPRRAESQLRKICSCIRFPPHYYAAARSLERGFRPSRRFER
jgi:hypothetical protein